MRRLALPLLLVSLSACGDDDSSNSVSVAVAQNALSNYKRVVSENYEDALAKARELQASINAFLAAPSAATLEAAKQAWIAARAPYGPSEAFRFYDGPIDNADNGPEGQLNGWPLDENYIDYVRESANAGIINDPVKYPTITKEVIAGANENGGETNLSTGYHAIEFLLWGQDDVTPGTGAGKRPFTDYVVGGSAQNQERRKAYLSAATELLIDDLEQVAAAWRPGADNFAAHFGVDDTKPASNAPAEAIKKILRSLGSMAKAELAGERMTVAWLNRTQEDEHSCFSDNTALDLLGNGVGLQNVWLGRYGNSDGVGIDEVVAANDPALAAKTTADLNAALAKLQELVNLQGQNTPIDVVISSEDGSLGRTTMRQAIEALRVVATDIEQAAKALGLSVQFEEPSQTL